MRARNLISTLVAGGAVAVVGWGLAAAQPPAASGGEAWTVKAKALPCNNPPHTRHS